MARRLRSLPPSSSAGFRTNRKSHKCWKPAAGDNLPGMTAAMTPLPVLGVPVESAALQFLNILFSVPCGSSHSGSLCFKSAV